MHPCKIDDVNSYELIINYYRQLVRNGRLTILKKQNKKKHTAALTAATDNCNQLKETLNIYPHFFLLLDRNFYLSNVCDVCVCMWLRFDRITIQKANLGRKERSDNITKFIVQKTKTVTHLQTAKLSCMILPISSLIFALIYYTHNVNIFTL